MTFWDCLWRTLIVLTLLTAGSILGLITSGIVRDRQLAAQIERLEA